MITLKLRPSQPAEPVLQERPKLAPGVLVHDPVEEGAPWIVQSGDQRYLRIGATMAHMLRSADGRHTSADIATELGSPWTPELVGQGLLKAQKMRLLEDEQRKAARQRRVKFVPPLTFQFTLLNPDPLLRAVRPLLRRFANRSWAAAMLAVSAGGLLTLIGQAADVRHALATPLPLAAFATFFLVAWAGTAIHEMSHGAVLSHYGGRPSRMGVMLFYLTPAFFCDVSDGWRLPRGSQRVRIALAGIAAQAVIGGLAALAALATSGTAHEALLLASVGGYTAGLFNLVPFIKLDGYLALMSHLDVSHLRDRAMTDARRMIARVLYGGTHTRELPQFSWSPLFGLACMIFPAYVVAMAFTLWQSTLSGLGIVGLTIASLLLGYLTLRMYSGADRLVREALAAGASKWRVATVTTLAAAAVAALLHTVPVSYSVPGGFVRDGDRLMFVVLGDTDRDAIRRGAEVRLRQSGILLHTEAGQALIAGDDLEKITVPLSTFVPVRGIDDVKVPALGVPLDARTPPDVAIGTATVQAGHRSLGRWLYLRYLAPFWR